MSIPSAVFRNDYDGDASTADYIYSFKIFNKSHVKVVISDTIVIADDVTLVEGTDYTVSGVGLTGGVITLVDGTGLLVGGFLPVGKHISIIRSVPLVQESTFSNQGRNFPETMENALDYLMMVAQQQQDELNRALKVLDSQATSSSSLVFPSVATRAGMLLGFDAQGDPIAVSAGGAVSGSWQTLIDAGNLVGARVLLGFAGSGGTVQTANIEAAGLAAAALASNAVTTAKINALAVTTAKIADANVTLAKLAADALAYMAAPGDIKPTAASAVQAGWLLCDGSAVSRSTYAALFSAIGVAYGSGDGSTTFNVPDAKGRFLRGLADYANVNGSGSASSNNATFTAHPYKHNGVRVRLASGALSGLSASTDYFVIVIDANTLAFAVSRANAVAASPTKIVISGANSGVIQQWEDPDASTREKGSTGGNSGATLGSVQDDKFRSHFHQIRSTPASSGSGENHFGANLAGINTESAGDNETRPLNLSVNYLIKT